MDSTYDKKFEEMKKYIPFLESMIKRLETTGNSASTNPRQAQLDKIRSLRDLLLNKNKRMKMDNLLKCEQVLVNLYAKVEQRDPFLDAKLVEKQQESKDDELQTVRNKLKTVTRAQDSVETLPEIARANDIELNYTGSKEPALFQRRPNKSSMSPVRCSDTKMKSPQSHYKRNYTRVLVSPSRTSLEQTHSEKPLFSRRSPPKTISVPPIGKKEKKKSKASKMNKANDLNITLNVPQESLNSLNTKDILSRIMNCKDGDVDIDTLRELRTRIIGELKQTGKNDDISDLILKSYNIKTNPRKQISDKKSKKDVEEGELSDSESEVIESIYGSLPVVDKDKSSTIVKTIENKDQQHKIQICLVIADKIQTNTLDKTSERSGVIDLVSELEMCSENDSDKSKDIISIDSDTPHSSPPEKSLVNKKIGENSKAKRKIDITPLVKESNSEKVTECITVEDDEFKDQTIKVLRTENTDEPSPRNYENNCLDSREPSDSSITSDAPKSSKNNDVDILNTGDSENSQNAQRVQETTEQRPKFVANFYKPIEEQLSDLSTITTTTTVANIFKEKENTPENKAVTNPVHRVCDTSSNATPNLGLKQNSDDSNKCSETVTSIKTFNEESACVEKEKPDDSQNIPLLNEPTVPPKAKASVLSEIDILQALKNEILSGSISMPGTEAVTPLLHQPKLIKVANAQEVIPKKKISIEKYKEKVATSKNELLFFKKRSRGNRFEHINKKQSLKLTEKECERFNFPKRLSLDDDDDDIDDISDDDFLAEDRDDSLGLDDIYGNLAPKSPDNEILSRNTSPPVIIPTDPTVFEENVIRNKGDIDMRAMYPTLLQSQPVPQPVIPPLLPPPGSAHISPSPVYGIDRNINEIHLDLNKTPADVNRIGTVDPRKRRDLSLSAIQSPNPYSTINPERTPRSFASVVGSAPNMTPNRTSNMTPSYMPTIPQIHTTHNARTFEMTPSHQTFELEEPTTRKHVYAPLFSTSENRERESSVSKDGPSWDMNKNDPRRRRSRWEESNKQTRGSKWDERDPRSNSGQTDGSCTPRYEDSYTSMYEKYNSRLRGDNMHDRRELYSKADCPLTPVPSFGWSECPQTPSSVFGRKEAPMTPTHSFGRSDCPTTPVHPFGRGDCPSTTSTGFGRNIDMSSNHSYLRPECPSTPSHTFGRSDCPQTPCHSFGRSECPRTPSHPFGRSESIPYNRLDSSNNSNKNYSKDPRLNRKPTENESSFYSETEHNYKRKQYRNSSYKSQSKYYGGADTPRNYERERSVERYDKDCDDRIMQQYDRNRRDVSLGPPTSNDAESNRLYSRSREKYYDGGYIKDYDCLDSRRNQRERSVGRTLDTTQSVERTRSTSRAVSVGRGTDKKPNKDNISFQSESGRNFIINTSVKSTFQDVLPSGKPIQVFEYSIDARRQRAASVGRTLLREGSVGRKLSTESTEIYSSHAQDRKNRFKRACSVGRDIVKPAQTFQEVKADFEAFKSKFVTQKFETREESKRSNTSRGLQGLKADFEAFKSKLDTQKFETTDELKQSNTSQTLQGLKADFETFKSKLDSQKFGTSVQSKKYNTSRTLQDDSVDPNKEVRKHNTSHLSSRNRKDTDTSHQDRKSKQNYSPKKNYRDPRMRNEHLEMRSRYKIDRRSDSRDSRKTGIIYSNDNIAKGTIMGSGFGVKNYKIPKIKRVEPEVLEVKNKVNENTEPIQKRVIKKNSTESNNKTTEIFSKETSKPENIEEPVVKNTSKNKNETKHVEEPEVRVTRAMKKVGFQTSNEDVDNDNIIGKTPKSKKSVIYDSDTDSVLEEIVKKSTQEPDSKLNSPSKKISPVTAKGSQKHAVKESLDTNFEIDDMEIFSENLESSSVMDNINALIADLDYDLNTSKAVDDSFTTDIENIMGTINSPEGNSLGDISEVIEKDLNKANKIQQNLFSANLVDDTTQNMSETTAMAKNVSPNANDVSKDSDIKESNTVPAPISSKTISTNVILEDMVLPKVDEAIVSTTDIDQGSNENKNQTPVEVIASNLNQSIPDSTINKSDMSKTNDGLPDSTNELHCELSSDVTSTYDTLETSNKGSEVQSTTQKETFNSIGSLLSILQDKSKIKELLAMLGGQSSENEKIKKKLEKLSEIVSDEDDDEIERKLDTTEENLLKDKPSKETVDNKPTRESVLINVTETNDKYETMQKDEVQNSDETLPTSKVANKTEIGISLDETTKKEQCKSSETENASTINERIVDDKVNKIDGDNLPYNNIENKTLENKINKSNIITINKISSKDTNETNKLGDEDKSDVEENVSLAKKTNKKIKGRKLKVAPNKNTNKRVTRVPVKRGVKKRGELQKLQEDIKEMFMSEDILNATGIRMCRLAKMVTEQEGTDSGPVVVLEKVKEVLNQEQPIKIRKKPGPKPKNKAVSNKDKSPEIDVKVQKPNNVPKYKPGPKSKTKQKSDETDPYEFDTDSIADTNTTKESDDDSSDSENDSLASSHSFGSSEVLADVKKKPRRKRRGIGGWQSGIIKSKNKKKKEQKLDFPKKYSQVITSQKPVTIPDLKCFTDKSYCFQKGITTYDCRLCVYSGADIVNHYKKQHPHTEIPLSRMDQKTAELAIQQCEQKNFQALSKISSDKYTCRFCHKEYASNRNVLETFFWHVVSNHTGEFKHLCSECVNVTRCPLNLDIPPPPKDGGQLIGYICQKCNFTQISLENLKTHVIVHHNDEQTEVFTINLAIMSNKTMNAMLRRSHSEQPRMLRSLRSNQSLVDSSDIRDDRSDGNVSENSGHNSDCDPSELVTKEINQKQDDTLEQKPKIDQMKAKLTFENDEPSDDNSVKIEREERDESSHFEDTLSEKPTERINKINISRRGNSDEIVDYPHFKLNYTESGAKEYVCCINRNDSHYNTSLLISMKKHIQSKHPEKWDGYCFVCKVIVTLQGVQSDFRDCLTHFLDKHIDDFPVLEKVAESSKGEMETSSLSESNIPSSIPEVLGCAPLVVTSAVPATAVSPAIPTRVATPPVERTASPSYIAVRPLAELISRELVRDIEPQQETSIALPKIENVVSLGNETVSQVQPSPSYPTNVDPFPLSEKPFLYEEVQAEVMSKKHRVVLDVMMAKENLVRVFKCAGRFCSFTTDSPEDALLHASTHQRVGGEGALNCAYCNYDACDNGIDLVMHVFKEHSRCLYCCPMCFYRAAASQLVGTHYEKAHGGAVKLQNVLRSTSSVTPPAPGHSTALLSREVAVQHFVCNHDDGACAFKTYIPGKFIEHLQQRHTYATTHLCNICSTAVQTPTELLVHLRSHDLKLYQCTWCIHGANNETELLAHAAAKHPEAQPQAYIRVITTKEGGKRVLPLAYLNKSKMPTEDVVPNTAKENPVKEAERSIDLEKLIAHTMMMIDSSSQSAPDVEDKSTEEPMEMPVDNLPDEQDSDEAAIETLSTSDQDVPETRTELDTIVTEETNTSIQSQKVVKIEPAEVLKDITSNEVICLDSDEETDATTEALNTPNTDVSVISTENVAQKISTEVSTLRVTDAVSITKVAEEASTNSSKEKQNENSLTENVIDLSDDDLDPLKATKSDPILDKNSIFKCPRCLMTSKSANALRHHIGRQCSRDKFHDFKCPHLPCSYSVNKMSKLFLHYSNVHSGNPKKSQMYCCGVCNNSFSSMTGAKLHIRSVHKVSNYATTVNVDASGVETYTIKKADEPTEPVRISGRKTSTEIQRYQAEPIGVKARKSSTELKKRYGIEDIDKLPITPILDTQVFCDLCEFGTKVRLNMVRHLQQHAGNIPVPHTAPVNPVPHLETNEMHFDRMVNLASSSVASRAPDKLRNDEPTVTLRIPPSESSRYPKYVPERLRYTCGAKDCSYISVDMAMFRCHWETLHPREEEYRCVHCPPTQALTTSISLTAARILGHLRMHDVHLYACSACSYYHYRKHLVETHISELHKEGSVKIVREEYQPEPVTPTVAAGAPTMDLKLWQCGLCDFSSMLRPKVVNHCATEHQSKMQYKCGYCSFRSSAKENILKHQSNAHQTMPEDLFYYFYREDSFPDENEIPLWQKQRQKMRLDERDVKTEPQPTGPNSETPATPVSTTSAPVPIDLNIVKEEVPEEQSRDTELSVDDLCKKFSQFCEPDGIKYKCCLCNVVREHSKENMQSHLYEELNYRRWECVICSYKAFHKNGLHEHMASEHSRQFTQPRPLPVDVNIEKWVQCALEHQQKAIETNLINLSVQKIQGERPTAPASPKQAELPVSAPRASDTELQKAFGEFGTPKNQQFACPKCEFTTKDEAAMVTHLESELSKIRWGCTNCTGKYQTFHEAQFHCKSIHTGQPARPKEAIRDPSLRSGWVKAVASNQKQFIKCISETNREPTPEKNSEDSDQNENSLLVAMYDEPVLIEEQPAKRPMLPADSDEDRLVIDEPPTKKLNIRKCPFCEYNIQNVRYVREHILKEHYNIKPYKCYYCSFEGTRHAVTTHTSLNHSDLPHRIITVEVPNMLPGETKPKEPEPIATTSKHGTDSEAMAAVAKTSKRDVKDAEEVAKIVCLYCEKSIPETDTETHTHGNEKAEFAKRGDVVVKCCKCLALRLSITSLEEHFDACHPGEKVLDNYAYFKLQVDTREIHCCGHCYKKFKFLRDLKVHHLTSHTSLSLSYTSIPFSHNLYTEGDIEIGKRKAEDMAGPSTKRIAIKSTSKLPNSGIAKKSTTKLPYTADEDSNYGSEPVPPENYKNITLKMPMCDSIVDVNVEKFSGILKKDPKVVVKDYRS